MIVVAHRRNRVAELEATPSALGVEMDVRVRGDRLVVAHDPFEDGPDLDTWLEAWNHALLVVNLKEEGIEGLVLQRLARQGIADFFLLGPDPGAALPWFHRGERRIAVRVSEVHHPATALGLAGRSAWVWLDGFRGFPRPPADIRALADAGYQICLVSPELYGRGAEEIGAYRAAAEATGVPFAAVCTALPEAWIRSP